MGTNVSNNLPTSRLRRARTPTRDVLFLPESPTTQPSSMASSFHQNPFERNQACAAKVIAGSSSLEKRKPQLTFRCVIEKKRKDAGKRLHLVGGILGQRLTFRSFIFGRGEGLLKSNRRTNLERDCEGLRELRNFRPQRTHISGDSLLDCLSRYNGYALWMHALLVPLSRRLLITFRTRD